MAKCKRSCTDNCKRKSWIHISEGDELDHNVDKDIKLKIDKKKHTYKYICHAVAWMTILVVTNYEQNSECQEP